jgi:molybdate transport system regulatory protein
MGPGKMRLLELIGETGSIAEAARRMRMSYRRAWLLLHTTEAGWRQPLVERATGGRGGGGARLTPFGHRVLEAYRAVEGRLQEDVRTIEQEIRRLLA